MKVSTLIVVILHISVIYIVVCAECNGENTSRD